VTLRTDNKPNVPHTHNYKKSNIRGVNIMSSTSDKISGKTKQAVGKMTDNKKLEAKGKVEETKGEMKSKIKHVGDKLAD